MKCHECHQRIEVQAKYCPYCGSTIEAKELEKASRVAMKTKTTWNRKGILIILFLSIFLGAGFWAWQSDALSTIGFKQKVPKQVIAYPYQDAFGLNILNEDLEVVAQDVGAEVIGFTGPVSYVSRFNEYGVAVVRDQNYLFWLVNHQGEIISEGFNTINSSPFGISGPESSYGVSSSINGVHTASNDDKYFLLSTTGDVLFETVGVILPFEGNDVTVLNDYSRSHNNGTERIASGVITDSGEIIIPVKYHYLSVVDNEHFIVKEWEYEDMYRLINRSGQTIIEIDTDTPPVVAHTDNDVFISATNYWGETTVFNINGESILRVPYTTNFSASENGKYLYPSYLEDNSQQYIVYTAEGETHFQGDKIKDYHSVNNNNWLAFSDYSGFGYIDLETRESVQIPYEMNDSYFSFINGTNVGTITNNRGEHVFFNSRLEEIFLPETQLIGHFVQFELNDIVYIYKNKGFYVLNKDGDILSEDALYAFAHEDSVYIQETNGKAYLLNKDTGKIIKEKK